MTTPGPGVPPAMVSGIVAARLLHDKLQANESRAWVDFWSKCRHVFRATAAEIVFSAYLAASLLLACLLSACGCRRSRFAWPSASQWACLRLFYGHGSTFFAASTLMSWRAFWDTTALYALFRAADDHVDQIGVSAQDRRAGLARFERAFWRGLNGDDEGDASVDPILPAVIETCRRLRYPPALFEKFFASMRVDCARDDGAFECHDMHETCRYMEGSAAVIGEFMLPILLDGSERASGADDIAALRDAARALGNAFQLTNMIRDVEEDRSLNRIYLPGSIVSGDREKIERAIAAADSFYATADRGIARLPTANGARDVVRLARHMYASIHDAIRDQGYDLHRRARVSESAKLRLAWRHLGTSSTIQLACTHVLARLVALLLQYWAPLVVLAAAILAPLYATPELSYAQFHHVFTMPALAVLWAASTLVGVSSNPNQIEHVRRFFCWSLDMCFVATVYTTPWDNALVWSGVWGYPSERPIWALLGWVPIEEYAFFSIETLMVAGTLLVALPFKSVQSPPTRREPTPVPNLGRLVLLVLFALGIYWYPLYMGRILTWSVPVLAIQWEYGAHALMAHAWSVVPAIVLSSATLCVLDAWAIADGIWAISADHLLIPKTLTFGLPLEEGVFFVVTTCMCAGGITLVVVVDCFRRTRKVSWMEALCAIHQWGPATPPPPPRESHRAWIGHLHAALIVATIALVVHYESLVEPHAISLLVAGVLLIGVPHGALDGAFLPAAMIPLYVFGMLATCALWRLAPAIALLTFVATSVWHFGEGDVQPARHERATWRGVTEIVARGGMFLVAVYHHPAACLAVFRILIGVGHAAFALDFILDVFVPLHFIALWIAAALVALRFHESRRGWAAAIETVAVWTLFARVSPLVAFGVYFNGIHSVRHVLRVLDFSVVRRQQQQHQGAALNDTMPLVWAAVFYTIPVLIAAAAIVGGSSIFRGEVLLSFVTHNVLRVIFIGLSALTTPHVVLVARTFSS